MAGYRYVSLSRPVGRGGANDRLDVMRAQELINAHLPTPLKPSAVDGISGPLTENAITEIERRLIGAAAPDGRLDPHGPTLRALNHLRRRTSLKRGPPPTAPAHPADGANPPGSAASSAAASRSYGGAPALAHAPDATAPASTHGGASHGQHHHKRSGIFPPEVIAAAQAAPARWGAPASITMAQWALESGGGQHMPKGSNNPFGIKAGRGRSSSWRRPRRRCTVAPCTSRLPSASSTR